MKSAIEGILYGTWGKSDFIPRSEELSAQSDIVMEWEKKLEKLLEESPEKKEVLKRLQQEIDEQTCIEVRDYYKAGFRNGFFISMELFTAD
ncbi:MAG: hypothetical protein K2G44_06925 [Clostridia bacterium]|nr:hypothetical protein [Clostridia bacterium]